MKENVPVCKKCGFVSEFDEEHIVTSNGQRRTRLVCKRCKKFNKFKRESVTFKQIYDTPMPYGKYKGVKLGKLFMGDRKYVNWFLTSKGNSSRLKQMFRFLYFGFRNSIDNYNIEDFSINSEDIFCYKDTPYKLRTGQYVKITDRGSEESDYKLEVPALWGSVDDQVAV